MSNFLRDREVDLFEEEMIGLGLGSGAIQPLGHQLVGLVAGAVAMAVIASLAVVREPAHGAAAQNWAAVQTHVVANQ